MHLYKKVQIIALFWLFLCSPLNGYDNSSLSGNENQLANDHLGKPINGQALDEDYILIKIKVSRLFMTSWKIPIEELSNRSEIRNTSTTIMERFPLLKYYMTGLQLFFIRLFTGELHIQVSSQKDSYKEQLKALQVQHEKYNHTMRRWRQFMAQMIQDNLNMKRLLVEVAASKGKTISQSKAPPYPTSTRPNYYDVMTMESYDEFNEDESKDTEEEQRSVNQKSSYSLYQKAINLALLDEPRVIHFYIQEIFRLSSILMNRTRYIM